MRKINFLLGVLAVAATGLLSSCDWSDDDSVVNPNVVVPSLGGNTLVVNANVSASFIIEGQTPQNGTTATFAVDGKKAVVKVSASGYESQEVEVNFGENTMMSIDVQLAKAPTNPTPQAEAKGNVVKTEDDAFGEASITVPADVAISVNTTDPFSVVAYPSASNSAQTVEQGVDVSVPALALSCKPEGAQFNPSVKLTANIEGAAGYDFTCVSGGESVPVVVDGNSVSADVKHFSVWSFALKAKVDNVQSREEVVKKGSILLVNGNNPISYTQKYGFTLETSNANALVSNFLVNQFGKAGSINKTVNITSDKAGSADYTVKQAVKTYTFKSGTQTFIAKVYGAVTVTIDRTTSDTSGHSGGTGK